KLRVALTSNQDTLQKLQREFAQLDARKRALEEVNFSRAVDMILGSDLDGIHGTLAQLGSVDGPYATALEMAMGGRIQNIVVDDDHVAKEGIEHLKRHRGGRATFLPLTKIRPARPLPVLPNASGVVDYAINL